MLDSAQKGTYHLGLPLQGQAGPYAWYVPKIAMIEVRADRCNGRTGEVRRTGRDHGLFGSL